MSYTDGALTVKELYETCRKLIEEGKGDYACIGGYDTPIVGVDYDASGVLDEFSVDENSKAIILG